MDDELRKFIESLLPVEYNVLDAQVDVDVQIEYFEFSRNVDKNFDKDKILEEASLLKSENLSNDKKKELLIKIASIDRPEAFRIIESYLENPEKKLHDWALLALQDSRMLLQGKYLDEPQVFISTGLGGKGKLLRYFVVLFAENDRDITDFQFKLVRNEVEAFFRNIDFVIEEFKLVGNYITITILLPITINLKTGFEQIISECNIYGNFLDNRCLLTNVKILSDKEIKEYKPVKS